jgi:GNAT superfamily N-acetyltransferase
VSSYRFAPLDAQHNRAAFSCRAPPLDDYLKTRARQDARRLAAAVFVMAPNDAPSVVAGYYTLSATSIALKDLPEEFVRKLPRYPFVPATLLGRLARDERFPGTGKLLLTDALARAWRQSGQIAAAAVVVEAKDDRARKFYESFGFHSLPAYVNRLYLPMPTVEKLL